MKNTLKRILIMMLFVIIFSIQNIVVFAGTSGVSGLFKYNLYGDTIKWVEITGYTERPSGDIVIPEAINGARVDRIGDNAFSNCSGIRSVSIPSEVSVIGENAFSGCINLTKVIIQDGNADYIVNIGEGAFSSCSYLESITLSRKKSYIIRDSAFNRCKSLKDIYFRGTKEQYDACSISVYDYNDNFSDAEVYYIDSVREITLNKSTMSIIEGNCETLFPTVIPSNASNKNILWSSSDSNIATVADGVVVGVSDGTATISAKTADKNKVATCVVTVTPPMIDDVLGGGDGTSTNPYRLDNEEELQIISDIPYAHYILEDDIILTKSFKPLCALDDVFSGVLDGNGHTISNLTISDYYENSGLFGKSTGTIRNLKVVYSSTGVNYVFSTDANFGGIVGYNEGNVINCEVEWHGNIQSSRDPYTTTVGGIVGENRYIGEIINCKVSGDINVNVTSASDDTQQLYLGGIAGRNLNRVDGCQVSLNMNNDVVINGYIYATSYIGGIAGSSLGEIKNSDVVYNIKVGEATKTKVGGIVGLTDSVCIENVSASGKIVSIARRISAGGIIGDNTNLDDKTSIIKAKANIEADISEVWASSHLGGIAGALGSASVEESYADVNFTAIKKPHDYDYLYFYCGGIAGSSGATITNCFSQGDVISDIPRFYSSGLVGYAGTASKISNSYAAVSGVKYGLTSPAGTVSNSFYDSDISGCSDTGYGTPKTTLGMKMKTIYTNSGWDFVNIWDISSSDNNGYPYLRAFEDKYTWMLKDGVLSISGDGKMDDYETTADVPWYSERLNINKIVISDGITSIGSKAFYGCINATIAKIPESVTVIGENAFMDCDEISISGMYGSYAQKYANENNILFVGNYTFEPLPDLNVELAETNSRWYFYVSNDTYTENAKIYVGIYDGNNRLLTVVSENMTDDDVTSIKVPKVTDYSYAKIFEWVDMMSASNAKTIILN